MRPHLTSALFAAAALMLGCASTPDDPFEGRSFADVYAEILRECDDVVRSCPLVLLDTQPITDYADDELATLPASSIERIATTKGACLVEWRFGVTGYRQAVEIYTSDFEGERYDHAPMPVDFEVMCEFEGWQAEQSDGYTITDAVGDAMDPSQSEARTIADAVVGAFQVCARSGQGCPLVLIDTRPSAEFSRAELDAMPLSSIVTLETTSDACTARWRFGERGRNGAIEIYTEGFEGEALRHEEMPEEQRLRCEGDRMRSPG